MLKVVWQDASRNCGKGESILIVDDSPEQRALAQRMMSDSGMRFIRQPVVKRRYRW
jgi:PleD family two-component response regulator